MSILGVNYSPVQQAHCLNYVFFIISHVRERLTCFHTRQPDMSKLAGKKLMKDAIDSLNDKNDKRARELVSSDSLVFDRLMSTDLEDLVVLERVVPLQNVSSEFSSEARRRLKCVDSWRRMNEEPYACGRRRPRERSSVDITDKMVVRIKFICITRLALEKMRPTLLNLKINGLRAMARTELSKCSMWLLLFLRCIFF
jgi:hypothetical protein